jgi:uncharacterized protein YjiS (DUF1127 family)
VHHNPEAPRHPDVALVPGLVWTFAMSAHTANQKLNFQLPSLSYIDAKWEEPNLRAPATTVAPARKTGLLARLIEGYQTWQRDRRAMSEFAAMSDYELADMGLSRSDTQRVFNPALNEDLRQRGQTA